MTYIALLRGINVSGQKLLKMEELRKVFEDMGFKNVRSYIQSGNIIFEAPKTKDETLSSKIEKQLDKVYGYEVTVVIRTIPELEEIIKKYPFSKVKGHEEGKIYAAFLNREPDKNNVKELISLSSKNEMFHLNGKNLYILVNVSFPESLMGKNIVEKKLKVRATVRNWNTVNKLASFT